MVGDGLPDELTLDEALAFLDQITDFGKPYPVVILTGGDIMKRVGLEQILRHAYELGIPVSMAPSATPLLNESAFSMMKKFNVRSLSLSLDGASKITHDWLRGLSGTFDFTLSLMKKVIQEGFTLQINTTVFKRNVRELPELLKILIAINYGRSFPF
ncbi:MAG: radical SAM protein [Thermoplasmatales archaeon]